MPKKGSKKDGGGKGSGMTDEERVVFLQQRAEAEKDNAKRKEEMLTQFLKVSPPQTAPSEGCSHPLHLHLGCLADAFIHRN
jgi:hypothetical protein